MVKTRTLLFLIAVPLLALLIACGGGDKDDSSSSGSGDGNTSSSGSQSGSGDDRATGTSDSDISLENCKQYASFASSAAGAFASTSTGAFKIDKNALNDMLKKSPKEIQGDMKIIVEAFVGYVEALDKAGVNLNDPSSFARLDSAKLAQVEAAAEKFDDPKITAASERVEAFFEKECS